MEATGSLLKDKGKPVGGTGIMGIYPVGLVY